MKNWAIHGFLYDFNPSPYKYLKFKWYHFHFCKKDDPTITASLYLDNLVDEVKAEIAKQTSVNKKSLSLAVIKKILENKEAKHHMTSLFEKHEALNKEEIKHFLNQVSTLIYNSAIEQEQITYKEEPAAIADFPVRTYVIATPILRERRGCDCSSKVIGSIELSIITPILPCCPSLYFQHPTKQFLNS